MTPEETQNSATKDVAPFDPKAVDSSTAEPKTPEVIQADSRNDLLAAIKENFATGISRIYINSLDKEVSFKEISVKTQKTLTRIMSGNENRKDIVYDAQCALINEAALDKSFDVFQVSEFDRLKLLMALYQANMFANDITFTCEQCGAENSYKIDFDAVLRRLDEFDLEPKTFTYDTRSAKYEFTLRFPSVKLVSSFYKSYCQKQKGVPRKMNQVDENTQNMEYVNLFIAGFSAYNKDTNKEVRVDLSKFPVSEIETFVGALPQDVLYSDHGVLMFITNEFLEKLNESFDTHECAQCGTIHEKGEVNSPESFF